MPGIYGSRERKAFGSRAQHFTHMPSAWQRVVRGIAEAAGEAQAASDNFADWLDRQADSKTGESGVGKDNMTWALKNIHYLPLTWEEEVVLVKRELARSHAALRLEENRNRSLPETRTNCFTCGV